MLDNLLDELKKIEKEVDQEYVDQLPIEERAALLHDLANKVLKTLEHANKEIPKQHSNDSGVEIPTSEF
jgi:ribosomal protein S25